MKRLPDWPKRLHDFVDGVKRQPFDWTAFNCGEHWAAGAVMAVTGEDIVAPYKGRWSSARGMVRVMKNEGHADLADWLGSILPEQHVSRVRPGDIAAIPKDDAFGFTLGIVNGEMIMVLGEQSMGLVPLFDATRAFRVGD